MEPEKIAYSVNSIIYFLLLYLQMCLNDEIYENLPELKNIQKLSFPNDLKTQYLSSKQKIIKDISSILNIVFEIKTLKALSQEFEMEIFIKIWKDYLWKILFSINKSHDKRLIMIKSLLTINTRNSLPYDYLNKAIHIYKPDHKFVWNIQINGLGTALFQKTIEIARQNNIPLITLFCYKENIEFYKKLWKKFKTLFKKIETDEIRESNGKDFMYKCNFFLNNFY